MPTIRTLTDVVAWRLCLGCGACAYICPDKKVQLFDFTDEGIRPVLKDDRCGDCTLCLEVCPAVQTDFSFEKKPSEFEKDWGPVLELWEGHAADPEIRFKGASGGALTAISAYCLEVLGMHGVLHTGQDRTDPVRNLTRMSRSREELLSAVGSRYSPASVCNGLGLVEEAPAPCVVIGKPAEIAAVRNAERLRSTLAEKVGVTLSFFCAETPSTAGTLALLQKLGVAPSSLSSLSFRGDGWPGHFAPVLKGQTDPVTRMTYRESWSFLQKFRPWSVQLWPDVSGELADISCGDPWYTAPDGKNPGRSLVLVRTERGREVVEGAVRSGYLRLAKAELWKLEKSQSGLLAKKGATWGRRLALRAVGLPVGRFAGSKLWNCWRGLSLSDKTRSILGTFRRVLARKLYRRQELESQERFPRPVPEGQGKSAQVCVQ